jgi:hypothetical protein
MCRLLTAAAAAVAILATKPAVHASETWTTVCDMGNGALTYSNPFRSEPRSECDARGQRVLSLQAEVPGIKFGKRKGTVEGVGSVRLGTFPPFILDLELAPDGNCYIYLDVDHTVTSLSVVGHDSDTEVRIPHELAYAPTNEIAMIPPPIIFTTPDGPTIRIEERAVINEAESCFGAFMARMARNPRAFYAK